MAAEMHATPLRVSRPQTKAMRLMLISRSSLLKPRPLLKCVRTISPSRISTLRPRALRRSSIASESVLLPAPESPVNQIVKPLFVDMKRFFLQVTIFLKCPALHICRNRYVELFENSWGHIHQLQACEFTAARAEIVVGIVLDDNAELSVVAIIRPRIVIEGVDRAMTDGAHG